MTSIVLGHDLSFCSRCLALFLSPVDWHLLDRSWQAARESKEALTEQLIERLVKLVISPQHVERLKERLDQARRIVYLGDNCGETVLDKLLIELIRDTYDPAVVFVSNTLPILNEATFQDVLSVSTDRAVQVVENGIPEPFTGTVLNRVSPTATALPEGSDLVISKGGGDYDTLTGEKGVGGKVSLFLRAKCHVYCSIHQLPPDALMIYNS